MEISSSTQLYISIGTLLSILVFLFKISWEISKFKENVEMRMSLIEKAHEALCQRMDKHDADEKENNTSERLARIEVDIQWIRQTLSQPSAPSQTRKRSK